jgi:sugar lactone lactonase YvrE
MSLPGRNQSLLVVPNGSRSQADGVSRARFAAALHRARRFHDRPLPFVHLPNNLATCCDARNIRPARSTSQCRNILQFTSKKTGSDVLKIITSALAVALLLVACGGGSGGAGPSTPAPSARGTISLLAGSMQQFGSQDGVIQDDSGLQARFEGPSGVAQDAAGNIYVTDGPTIRKIAPDGVVTTIAGAPYQGGSDDGPGRAARFGGTVGIVAGTDGELYVADTGNATIRKISAAGDVTTLAGTAGQYGDVDGVGAAARFRQPLGLALDAAGNLLVADIGAVRKVSADGAVTTFAGKPGEVGFAVGDGAQARLNNVTGVAVDRDGVVYVSEYGDNQTGGAVRRFDAQGRALPWGSAPQGVVRILNPWGIAVAPGGDIVVSEESVASRFNPQPAEQPSILRITPAGSLVLVAGRYPAAQDNSNGSTVPPISKPIGVTVRSDGRILFADRGTYAIRQIDRQNIVSTWAGGDGTGRVDGHGGLARFFYPQSISAGPDGTLYVADRNNAQIRRVTLSGEVSTLTMTAGGNSFNTLGSIVMNVAASPDGTLYVISSKTVDGVGLVDTDGHYSELNTRVTANAMAATRTGLYYTVEDRVEKMLPDGTKQVIASGFKWPQGIAVDASGTVYVADNTDMTVRAIDAKGVVRVIAGKPGASDYVDGTADQSRLVAPRALAVDNAGNVYVADEGQYAAGSIVTIRKISSDGRVSTVAGTYGGVPSQNLTSPLPGALPGIQSMAWYGGMLYAISGNGILAIGPVD